MSKVTICITSSEEEPIHAILLRHVQGRERTDGRRRIGLNLQAPRLLTRPFDGRRCFAWDHRHFIDHPACWICLRYGDGVYDGSCNHLDFLHCSFTVSSVSQPLGMQARGYVGCVHVLICIMPPWKSRCYGCHGKTEDQRLITWHRTGRLFTVLAISAEKTDAAPSHARHFAAANPTLAMTPYCALSCIDSDFPTDPQCAGWIRKRGTSIPIVITWMDHS